MKQNEKILVGVGILAAVGLVLYATRRPATSLAYRYPVGYQAPSQAAQDIAVASAAAPALSNLVSSLSNAFSGGSAPASSSGTDLTAPIYNTDGTISGIERAGAIQ
jgi:hypothetical protein